MKYIRTKDGKIFNSLALRAEEIVYKDEQGKWRREFRTVDPLKKVLETADTIKELCDEFVVCLFGNPQTITKNLLEIQHFIANQKLIGNDKNIVVYGAIWTDKGLIYVAKMNSKGELELL